MTMRVFTLLLGLSLSVPGLALTSAQYLPADAELDPAIPTPESVLGWEVGEWRVSHDQLVKYMETLAAASDRISIKTIGYSHERRPLLQLIFTQPENHGRLEEVRLQHLRSAHGEDDGSAPLVLWLGHSIHGDEASGSNAALLSAYYLAASRSGFVTDLLENSIILFDPSFNPDGLNRFASWSNSNRSHNPVADPRHRIHHQAWPGGRGNHYWFDLNRDWLPLVHPESRARVAEYHRWLPQVLTDQHERSSDGYFFQPGVPSRQNPLTPPENLELTQALAQYHARAMDAAGETYFTEDDYDDFYFGKGSTYPDINGSIGILFEQPRISGPEMDRDTGLLTFVNAIQNHLRTTLSTLRGAHELRASLKNYQRGFFRTMSERAAEAGFAAWVVGDDGDPARAAAFLDLLERHQVSFAALDREVRAGDQQFSPGHAWVLPAKQRQFGMLQALMETRTEFQDDTFYDVSAWTQPLAYNLPVARLERLPQTTDGQSPAVPSAPDPEAVAWIVPWRQMQAPALLQRLLASGARVRAATRPFTATTRNGDLAFGRGTLVVHAGLQDPGLASRALEVLTKAAADGMEVASATSSLTPDGPDLGGLKFSLVKPVKPLLIVGQGVSSYEAGDAWHHFDQRLGYSPVMVEMHRLDGIHLPDFTHLIMVDGDYQHLAEPLMQRMALWVREGGTLITSGRASRWAEALCFKALPEDCPAGPEKPERDPPATRAYEDFSDDLPQRIIGGTIIATELDLTHPLAYGYSRPGLPLFRRGATLLSPSGNAYSTPVHYAEQPLLAGFIGQQRQDEIRGQPALIAERQGAGLVVRFANNPLFRGFWRGTERLFDNALYMGQVVSTTELPE
jgi:hypothetical protein